MLQLYTALGESIFWFLFFLESSRVFGWMCCRDTVEQKVEGKSCLKWHLNHEEHLFEGHLHEVHKIEEQSHKAQTWSYNKSLNFTTSISWSTPSLNWCFCKPILQEKIVTDMNQSNMIGASFKSIKRSPNNNVISPSLNAWLKYTFFREKFECNLTF